MLSTHPLNRPFQRSIVFPFPPLCFYFFAWGFNRGVVEFAALFGARRLATSIRHINSFDLSILFPHIGLLVIFHTFSVQIIDLR